MATISAINVLNSVGTIIEGWNLKNVAVALAEDMSTIKTVKDLTAWLKKKINPFVADVGMVFYNQTIGKKLKVEDITTLITKGASLFDNALTIVEEIKKPKAERSSTVINTKIAAIVSDVTALVKPLAKLGDKDLWFLSIVTAGVGLISNVIATTDGIDEDEKAKVNESFSLLIKNVSSEVSKKLFAAPKSQILATPASEMVKKVTMSGGPLDLIFSFVTGITNGIDKHKASLEKYTADGIPEKIAKHDAVVDTIATIIHDTLSGFVKGADDVAFAFVQKVLMKDKAVDENKTYVDVIADIFKKLNPTNSSTSVDDKFYILENKSMVYGNDGNDDIGNYGFSNVTIWGGHDDDTLGSYKTDSATPQKNSIFGGSGDDQISVYDVKSTIYGGTGKDFINVVGTNNKIFGDADDDKLYIANGANNNTISGGKGDDFVVMQDEAKNTLIKYSSGDGNDTIYGFNEDDTLKVSGSYKTSASGNDVIVKAGEGSILLVGMAGKDININSKTITRGKENSTIDPVPPPQFPTLPATVASPIIYGTEHGDNLYNDKDYALIMALGLDDKITNYGAGVTIDGGSGNDSIYSSGTNTTIEGNLGDDSIRSHGSKVIINGADGNDSISNEYGYESSINGGSDNDCISNSHSRSVIINGGDGNDEISSGSDSVTIDAGAGDDSIYNSGFNITINAGGGFLYTSYRSSSLVAIDSGDGNDYIHNEGSHLVTINSGNGNDSIYNGGDLVTIDSGAGDDSIKNDFGDSVMIDAGTGNDYIYNYYLSKFITINGGKGNDTIHLYHSENNMIQYSSGDGNDLIKGFNSTSTLNITAGKYSTVESGDDIIVTIGKGKITLQGAASLSAVNIDFNKVLTVTNSTKSPVTVKSDVKIIDASTRTKAVKITGNKLDNTIISGSGKNTLYGGAGNDSLVGGSKNDSLSGGKGHDTLSGGEGNDKILGGAGNDILRGGKGNDSLWGNAGADTFIYEAGDGKDIIYGFDSKDTLTLDNMTFTASYNKSQGTITFKVNGGSVVLKDFTATTFHINDDTYKINGSKLKKQ